ncbi:ATP synthase F1 subunit delta [Marinitoga sp. 38H-ov]|uniref:ATP synthase F1 subunit delta n=1 Tax=Marinitoga sp. 38H-ov TaxID=1755814 RepID=UPI0013EA8B15|nr:ATP synthase F1 subunit delta [Marinitoga sp. 38H-ov]KAF2955741.1 hypothetical protein AS160_08855 [Marinitoga sp. 38H-ov]
MKNSISVASRYVEAFFEYLSEENKLDELDNYVNAIKNVVNKINDDKLFFDLIGNPLLPKDFVVQQIIKVAGIDDIHFNKFITALVYKKRQLMLPMIFILLEQKNMELKKLIKVKMITPYKLDEENVSELSNIIHKKTGRRAIIQSVIDESLIGGLQLQLEDTVFDYSVKGMLEKIGREYASKRG